MNRESKAKHTAGPWEVSKATITYTQFNITAKDEFIGEVGGGLQSDDEMKANAQLIACAPEMLEMLVKVQSFIAANRGKNYMVELLRREIDGLDGLITKATTI